MILYHYRSIDSAIKEIGNSTFHFASASELNDPLEGYIRVFWRGDRAAWEGLLRNYICSLFQAISIYLLQGDEKLIWHRSLIVDLHQCDDIPLGTIWKDLGDAFLEEDEVKKLIAIYGDNEVEVFEKEIQLILRFVLGTAMGLCIAKCKERRIIPEEEADEVSKFYDRSKGKTSIFDSIDTLKKYDNRKEVIKNMENTIEDMLDLQYTEFGFNDNKFLYGFYKEKRDDLNIQEYLSSEAYMKRKWISVSIDFPKIYVNQMKELIYPKSYVVCFSGRADDSSMWGNYADHHRGVCLVYETDTEGYINVNDRKFKPKAVVYGGDILERNFFETLGRLTFRQIETWLKGKTETSKYITKFTEDSGWREKYWEDFRSKSYRKLKAWEHENEYRIAIDNTFHVYDDPKSRNLKYEPESLKGIIFGINITEYDRYRIITTILNHKNEYKDFSFYQAEYEEIEQKINIRTKRLWRLDGFKNF